MSLYYRPAVLTIPVSTLLSTPKVGRFKQQSVTGGHLNGSREKGRTE